MSDTPDSDPLLDAIAAISEGRPVDWAALDALPASESLRARIAELRIIAGVADLARESPPRPEHATAATPAARNGGVTWGHLTILDKVGAGAFGEVYRAWDTKLDREVALKLLHPASNGRSQLTPTLEEGRQLARVRHPNVVTVYGADEIAGSTGIWMEFVRGRSLDRIVQEEGPLDPAKVATIGVDLCRALAAVHAVGLLHRDVKAPNVVRQDDGRLVLMDFGSVVEHDRGAVSDGSLAGTPLYLAPEVMKGAPPSVRSDVYAVGVLLYYLASGEFPVRAKTFDDVRRAVIAGDVAPLQTVRPGVPAGLSGIVERAMAGDPTDRFESAAAMEAALTDWLTRASRRPQRGVRAAGVGGLIIIAALTFAWVAGVWPFGAEPSIRRLWLDSRGWGPTTADGRRFACTVPPSLNLGLCDLETGDVSMVTTEGALQLQQAGAGKAVSPDGRWIAYQWWTREPDGADRFHLRIAETRTGGWRSLISSGDDGYPQVLPGNWTADSEYLIAVVQTSAEQYTLELIAARSGARDQLEIFDALPSAPRISPDGRYVLYDMPQASGTAARDVFVLDRESGTISRVASNPADDHDATWSADGRAVAFASDREGGRWGIWRVRMASGTAVGEPELLHRLGRQELARVMYFTDERLVFSASGGGMDVYTAPLDIDAGTAGPETRVSPHSSAQSASPDWSRDGRRLAYFADRHSTEPGPRRSQIVIQEAGGPIVAEFEIGNQVHQGLLAWMPDETLLVQRQRQLLNLDADSGEVLRSWSDVLLNPIGVAFASDGQSFYTIRGPEASRGVWRLDLDMNETGPGLGLVAPFGELRPAGSPPVVSPDERRFAVTARGPEQGTSRTYDQVILSVGGAPLQTTIHRSIQPCFARAWVDRSILVECWLSADDRSSALYALPVDGGSLRPLGLELEQIHQLKVHPSGRQIVFTAGMSHNEIWEVSR